MIGADGYAQYFRIGEELGGRTLLVELPAGASFAVYGGDGGCIEFSWVSGRESAVLPAQGMIVLVGRGGDEFKLRFEYNQRGPGWAPFTNYRFVDMRGCASADPRPERPWQTATRRTG